MNSVTELDKDMLAITLTFFAANVHLLLAEPARLESLARLAGVAPERIPAIRSALTHATSSGLDS